MGDLATVYPVNGFARLKYDEHSAIWGYIETEFAARQSQVPVGMDDTPGWAVANVRVGYDLKDGSMTHRFYVGADNMFDKLYRDHLSSSRGIELTEPGLMLIAGYDLKF